MNTISLNKITIYPIKSMAGISSDSAIVERRGLQNDRRWLLVDENGQFLTQRKYARMALISVIITPSGITVNAPGMGPLSITKPQNPDSIVVRIWRDECQATLAHQEAHNWFSQFLEIPAKLVYMTEETTRLVYQSTPNPEVKVSFADGFPYMLLSEESLGDLNNRLTEPVPMNRFRPNLVVKGGEAFEEDQWKRIQIGSIVFRVDSPCSRCGVPGIDQKTANRSREPIRTLSQYRTKDDEIFFGQNLIAEQEGTIHLNDPIEILERK